MSRIFFLLMLGLVLLGFLIATTINMYDDMEQLKIINQDLSQEFKQLQSNYEVAMKERDALKSENAGLNLKINELQQVYKTENQARIKAESEVTAYKNIVTEMKNEVSVNASTACMPPNRQSTSGEKISSVGSIGLGTLSLSGVVTFVTLIISRYSINKKHLKTKNVPMDIREYLDRKNK